MIWALGAGLVILGALVCLPVVLCARLEADGLRLRLGLFGGLLPVTLPLSSRATPVLPPRQARTRPSARVRAAGIRAGLDALTKVRLRRVSGELRLGLGDPALTGEFYGRAMGAIMALPLRDAFRLVPLFDRQGIEGQGEAVLSVVPLRLLPVGARFLRALR